MLRNRMIMAGLLVSSLVASRADAKELFGYVNLQRAILEVDEGKAAKKRLKKTFDKKQAELGKLEKELKGLKDKLDADPAIKKETPEARSKRAEFQRRLLELQQKFVAEQQALQRLEAEELAKISTKMRKVIRAIGKAGGYTLILEIQESRLLYAKGHLDLTNEVIRKYNSKHK